MEVLQPINTFLQPIDTFLKELCQPLVRTIGLPHLTDHFPTIVYSALFYTFVHLGLSPYLSKVVAGKTYRIQRGRRGRNNWNIHVVSMFNAVTLVVLSYRCLDHESLTEDKIFGWHKSVGTANALAVGYFIWDTVDAIVNFIDLGFVVHGLACTILYSLTFKPFLGYYSPRFLLWETSTIFLNIHWFLDKLDMTGSLIQYINGLFLLGSFFGVRIVYGWYSTYGFLYTLMDAEKGGIHPALIWTLVIGNVILNSLNVIWFAKMISALRKRFQGDGKPKVDGALATNGDTKPVANGHTHEKQL